MVADVINWMSEASRQANVTIIKLICLFKSTGAVPFSGSKVTAYICYEGIDIMTRNRNPSIIYTSGHVNIDYLHR